MRWAAALVLLALMLTGCESNIERSARLAKSAHHPRETQTGLVITRENPDVKVMATKVLGTRTGQQWWWTLRDGSSRSTARMWPARDRTAQLPGDDALPERRPPA